MADIASQIARLQAEITRQETELADLEAEILDLQRELRDFTARYERLIQPLAEKLNTIRKLVADMERDQGAPPPQLGRPPALPVLEQTWTPPPDYVPVEEQYRRTWEVPKQQRVIEEEPPPGAPVARTGSDERDPEKTIKQLYRRLARRYHPDLTTDPIERERRNRLMAEINEAYSQRDMEALKALDAQPQGVTLDQPLAALHLRQLQQIRDQLDRRLYYLRVQRNGLLHGEMMELKIRASLAAARGHDLLREMARDMERDYAACLDRLDQLRRSS